MNPEDTNTPQPHDEPVPAADGGAPEESSPEKAAAPAAGDAELEKLRKELDQAKQQADQLRRHAADVENSRKRLQRDRDRELADRQISLLKGLLPVVDNFERALASLEKQSDPEAVKTGTKAIAQLFVDYLNKLDVKPIPAVGEKYDPHLHEAVMQMPSSEHAAGLVSGELERGYFLGEKVLRHAKVVVSTGPAEKPLASQGNGGSAPGE